MQRTLTALAAAGASVLMMPVIVVAVLLGGDASGQVGACGSGELSASAVGSEHEGLMLGAFRTIESGNNYQLINRGDGNGGVASGAYQFMTGTWNNYGGYRDAYLAPPDVQDERAVLYLRDGLAAAARHGLDWTYVSVYWYYPAALGKSLDFVPAAHEGNTLTVAGYRQKWLDAFNRLANGEDLGTPDAPMLCGPSVAAAGLISPPGPLPTMVVDGFTYYQFPSPVAGEYVINGGTSAAQRYGTKELVDVVYTVAINYYQRMGGRSRLEIGDLNAAGHKSHKWGVAIDIAGDPRTPPVPADRTAAGYDRAATVLLGQLFIDTGLVRNIWWCDEDGSLAELQAYANARGGIEGQMKCLPGHANHFHVDLLNSLRGPVSEP